MQRVVGPVWSSAVAEPLFQIRSGVRATYVARLTPSAPRWRSGPSKGAVSSAVTASIGDKDNVRPIGTRVSALLDEYQELTRALKSAVRALALAVVFSTQIQIQRGGTNGYVYKFGCKKYAVTAYSSAL